MTVDNEATSKKERWATINSLTNLFAHYVLSSLKQKVLITSGIHLGLSYSPNSPKNLIKQLEQEQNFHHPKFWSGKSRSCEKIPNRRRKSKKAPVEKRSVIEQVRRGGVMKIKIRMVKKAKLYQKDSHTCTEARRRWNKSGKGCQNAKLKLLREVWPPIKA